MIVPGRRRQATYVEKLLFVHGSGNAPGISAHEKQSEPSPSTKLSSREPTIYNR